MVTPIYYTADEVSELLGISVNSAYRLIKRLNQELAARGYIVIAGKIPKKYFSEKYYGFNN